MVLGKTVNGTYPEAVFLLDSVYSVIISTVVIELEAPLIVSSVDFYGSI